MNDPAVECIEMYSPKALNQWKCFETHSDRPCIVRLSLVTTRSLPMEVIRNQGNVF